MEAEVWLVASMPLAVHHLKSPQEQHLEKIPATTAFAPGVEQASLFRKSLEQKYQQTSTNGHEYPGHADD